MEKAIVAVTDQNYLDYASYLFRKIRGFGITEPLFLLTDRVTSESFYSRFGDIDKCFQVKCENQIDELRVHSSRHVTRSTYIKLLMPDMVPNEVERILYLDVDIYLNESIRPILDFPLRDAIAGTQFANGESENLHGHSNHSYFSAGVLLINTRLWKKNQTKKKCIEILSMNPSGYKFQDMDVLNLAHLESWQILPPSFNFMNQSELNYVAQTKQIKPIVVHFPGPLKPWKKEASGLMAHRWREDFLAMGYNLESTTADTWMFRRALSSSGFTHVKFVVKAMLGARVYEKVKKWLMKTS